MGEENTHTAPTLWMLISMTARDPGRRLFAGIYLSYSGVPNSWTVPMEDMVSILKTRDELFVSQHTCSKQATDPRRFVDGHKHDGDAPVVAEVGNGLDA